MDCVKNIGCYPSCNAIKFPYPALETGVHFVVFDWLGTKKTIAFEAVEGEQFYIPNYFNESSDPVFSIKQPSGSYLCWDKELEALAVCPDDCGKDCDFYRHFTLEINQTSDFPGQENEDPDLAYSDKVYNIDEAHDNEDGTFTINVVGAANGDLAVDDNGTFYEYNDGIWTVKFKEICSIEVVEELPDTLIDCVLYIKDGKYYVNDGSGDPLDVTPESGVLSVTGSDGVEVDNTDPENPIVGLNQASQDSLDLADSAVQSVTGDGVDNTDPQNPVVNIPDQVCSVQKYNTFQDFPLEGEDCVLYVDLETKKQYILGPAWVEVPGITRELVSSLPPTGSDDTVYIVTSNLTAWYWNGASYDEAELVDSGTELPEVVSGFAYLLSLNQLFEAIDGAGYYDVSPLTTNLFTTDLTLNEDRSHVLERALNFNADGALAKIRFQRIETSTYPRLDSEFNRSQAKLYVYADPTTLYGVYVSDRIIMHTGQPNAAINTGTKYLKRGVSGGSTWEDITVPEYASDTDADNDTNLPSGGMYAVTGDRTVKRKP